MKRTEETLKARVRETPLTDRLSECRKRIGKMCAERRAPRMCIPVQHDDDDFFICTTLADAQATVEALQQERDRLRRAVQEEMELIHEDIVKGDKAGRRLKAEAILDRALREAALTPAQVIEGIKSRIAEIEQQTQDGKP